jgi:hypothetical protein
MKKQLLSIALFALATSAYGQVGINTTTPATTMDITAKNATGTTTAVDGLMIPRVDRQRAQSMTSVPTSTMIYVNDISTGAASGTAVNIDAVGFYYYNGVAWVKMGSGSAAPGASNTIYSGDGSLAGNRIVTQGANTLAFTSTATNGFSVDGNTFSVDAANNRVGLRTATPLNTLHLTDGTAASGMTNMHGVGLAITANVAGPALYFEHLTAPSGSRAFYMAAYNGLFGIYPLTDNADATSVPTGVGAPPSIGIQSPTGNVGMNTFTPQSTLDIKARYANGTNTLVDGLLVPRVARQRAQNMASVPVSTMVYITEAITGTQTGSTQYVDAPGFYYSDGTNWLKVGAAPLNVTAELDTNYTAAVTDDIILFTTTAPRTLTLPTSGVAVGKKYYISLTGSNGIDFLPATAIRNTSYNLLNAGTSATIMYLGGGKWDVVSGY